MSTSEGEALLERLADPRGGDEAILEKALSFGREDTASLFDRADDVRRRSLGDGIYLRGLIEFSNYCRNGCAYCGLQKSNTKLERYRLTDEEIMTAVGSVVSCGIKTVVLQSGEDYQLDPSWLEHLIRRIKRSHDLAITLSVGEWEEHDYRLWREAGADRYLLRIETSDRDLYDSLHRGMSFERRLHCLAVLRELGYQVGSGVIVGLRGQSLASLAKDLLFFRSRDFDMIGIGPLIPHGETELRDMATGDLQLTLRMVALTRILVPRANIPATTALGSLDRDYRGDALQCGANVLMPDFTPPARKRLYEIYPRRRCIEESGAHCAGCLQSLVHSVGRHIDFGRGDAVKAG